MTTVGWRHLNIDAIPQENQRMTKKKALPASQKPRVMRKIITMRYARRAPQLYGSGDAQAHGEGGWGAGCARATTKASFRSITCCSTPVRELMFNRMDRVFKQNEHSLRCSSWIVAIQSLSGDSRRSAWRTCQHQNL